MNTSIKLWVSLYNITWKN